MTTFAHLPPALDKGDSPASSNGATQYRAAHADPQGGQIADHSVTEQH
jgi:hypothetical protein